MDIQKIISLVTKTEGLIKNREMAAHVKEKGLADYVTQVDRLLAERSTCVEIWDIVLQTML